MEENYELVFEVSFRDLITPDNLTVIKIVHLEELQYYRIVIEKQVRDHAYLVPFNKIKESIMVPGTFPDRNAAMNWIVNWTATFLLHEHLLPEGA